MQQQQNKKNFIKKWHVQIEINFNGNNKREFGFCFPVYKKKLYFGIVIFLVGGRNCIMKNENCIIFPKL